MRVLIQRITEGKVTHEGKTIGEVGPGMCIFLSIAREDTEEKATHLAEKITKLRIFEDEAGKMNRSLAEVHGEILVVSEFTLYGDCVKGNRPSFSHAAPPDQAEKLYRLFVQRLQALGFEVSTGKFQAKMEVATVNDGPVTFILEV